MVQKKFHKKGKNTSKKNNKNKNFIKDKNFKSGKNINLIKEKNFKLDKYANLSEEELLKKRKRKLKLYKNFKSKLKPKKKVKLRKIYFFNKYLKLRSNKIVNPSFLDSNFLFKKFKFNKFAKHTKKNTVSIYNNLFFTSKVYDSDELKSKEEGEEKEKTKEEEEKAKKEEEEKAKKEEEEKVKKEEEEKAKKEEEEKVKKEEEEKNLFLINRFLVSKLLNHLIKRGKKQKIFKRLLNFFFKIQLVFKCNIFVLLHLVFKKIYPITETISIKHYKKIKKISVVVSKNRQKFLMFNWFLLTIKKMVNFYCLEDCLIKEVFSVLNKKGKTIRKKKEMFEGILKNNNLIHFRWRFKKLRIL